MTDMAENMSRMEANLLLAKVQGSKGEVDSLEELISNTLICSRLMKYLDSSSVEEILFQTSSMTMTISLVTQVLDKWECHRVLKDRELKNNQELPVAKTEIHLEAWVIHLEVWEEAWASMTMTSSAVVDSEACR